MKHTPGPWRVGQALNESPTIEAESDKRLAVAIIGMHRSSPEARANAMLMSAAPDLLEALQTILRGVGHPAEIRAKARAAIDKATGESQ